jgi:hypothetical protein
VRWTHKPPSDSPAIRGPRDSDYDPEKLEFINELLKGFTGPNATRRKGGPPLVWNVGGATSGSAPAFCAFMRYYWCHGKPRQGTGHWYQYGGSEVGTGMLWRPADVDIVFLFNERGGSYGDVRRDLEDALNLPH